MLPGLQKPNPQQLCRGIKTATHDGGEETGDPNPVKLEGMCQICVQQEMDGFGTRVSSIFAFVSILTRTNDLFMDLLHFPGEPQEGVFTTARKIDLKF